MTTTTRQWPSSFTGFDDLLRALLGRNEAVVKRERGDEVVLTPCPVSGCVGDKFSIHRETGLWNCPKCGEKGNAWQLVERLGLGPVASARAAVPRPAQPTKPRMRQADLDAECAAAQAALATCAPALEFLKRRRIDVGTARAFRLGVRTIAGRVFVGFPYLRANGSVAFVKWRSVEGKEFLRLPAKGDMPAPETTPLFNGWRLDAQADVYVTEGEIDAMTLWQAGFHNVVSVPNGAASLDDSWAAPLATAPAIFAAVDQDAEGEKLVAEMRRRFGREHVLRVEFGNHKDANDALQEAWTRKDFAGAMERAWREPPTVLSGAREIAQRIVAEAQRGARPEAIDTGFQEFDRTQRGLRAGELSVLTAHTGEGKTVWTLDMALRLAERGVPVTYVSLEQRAEDTVIQLMGMLRRRAFDDMPPNEMSAAVEAIPPCFYVAMEPENDRVETITAAIRYSVLVHGVKFVVVDHLDFLIEPKERESRYDAASAAVKALHAAARDNAIHVVLICQPTSDSGRSRNENRRPIQLEDIAETRLARQLANNGWLWSSDKEERTGHLHVAKARYGPAREHITIDFKFDGYRFAEVAVRTGGRRRS